MLELLIGDESPYSCKNVLVVVPNMQEVTSSALIEKKLVPNTQLKETDHFKRDLYVALNKILFVHARGHIRRSDAYGL